MGSTTKKSVRLTPHQKVVEGLKSKIIHLEETVAKNRAEISDLEDREGDMLRERDRFCEALGIRSEPSFDDKAFLGMSLTVSRQPSFMEIAVHCGRRFELADLAEKYLKLDNVKNVLFEVDEAKNAIREIRRNLEEKRS
jgi:hypothetical protein